MTVLLFRLVYDHYIFYIRRWPFYYLDWLMTVVLFARRPVTSQMFQKSFATVFSGKYVLRNVANYKKNIVLNIIARLWMTGFCLGFARWTGTRLRNSSGTRQRRARTGPTPSFLDVFMYVHCKVYFLFWKF